jgi:cupin fold WbuC family metalloprotein
MPAVIQAQGEIASVGPAEIAQLKAAAAAEPLRRARINLHPASTDRLHEMIIAFWADSFVPPHRHLDKSESFHVIEGEVDVVFFSDEGAVTQVLSLAPPGSAKPFAYRLNGKAWHSVIPRSPQVVLHETTNGPFIRGGMDLPAWAPKFTDAAAGREWLAGKLAEFAAAGGKSGSSTAGATT